MFKVILIFLCLAPMSAFAQAVIFSDDFTDARASRTKWGPDDISVLAVVANGACVINNTDPVSSRIFTALIGNNKPSTFTLSFIAKSAFNRNAGVYFCRQGSALSGYQITTSNDSVIVFKMTNGSGISILAEKSFEFNMGSDNKITVSKKDTVFNIFVNDVYLGTFYDSQYNSGDVTLLVRPNSIATFGAILMTDEFKERQYRTSFFDSFSGNGLRHWKFLSSGGNPEINEGSGGLRIKTNKDIYSWQYVDLTLGDEFSAKIETTFLSGDSSSSYGIVLLGEIIPLQNIPMVHFGINGRSRFYMSSGGSYSTTFNGHINGAYGNGAYRDTLEVRKRAGSSNYEFFANGVLLGTHPVANFKIENIGLFVQEDLEIRFNNFFAGKEGTTSISNIPAKRSVSTASFAGIKNGQINLRLQAGNYTAELYNLQGRLISSVEINAINGVNATGLRTTNLSKGVFILNVKQAGNSVLRNKVLVK